MVVRSVAAACSTLLQSVFVVAAANAAGESGTPLITHGDPVVLPGIGRILFAFALTVLLAGGLIYALKRWLPRVSTRFAPSTRFVVHSTVQNGVRLHVVSVDGRDVLIAEGKSGMAMTVLPEASSRSAKS